MTDTTTTPDASTPVAASSAPKRTSGGLGGKVLAELQDIASELGITGAEKMRKGALIDAIKIARGDAGTSTKAAVKAASGKAVDTTPPAAVVPDAKTAPATDEAPAKAEKPARARRAKAAAPAKADDAEKVDAPEKDDKPARAAKTAKAPKNDKSAKDDSADQSDSASHGRSDNSSADDSVKDEDNEGGNNRSRNRNRNQGERNQGDRDKGERNQGERNQGDRDKGERNQGDRDKGERNQGERDKGGHTNRQQNGQNNQAGAAAQGRQHNGPATDEDDEMGGRRRNRRGRNRNAGAGRGTLDVDTSYTEDDVLVPAAGILDILDNYAFVRTTGYLPSDNDVYVSLSMVRKWGLRRGDAVVGQVRQPREGERKEKFNPMVKIDSVNGMSLEEANKRVEFSKLTPLHPSERLHLEGEAGGVAGRIIDLVAPIGKGQRGLIVSPPKAGKTMAMQQLANAITANNPECHLMIVLVDERPEEVTDFQRSVKGEVIASTFDRPASDHTMVAELAIERAKRLVELGHDVVVLLDGITRLGRAYNQTAPTSGRVVSGGVDSSALHPAKQFFGAARNLEDGGSLTIVATALVETGSRTDEAIFEEFKGAANWELRLRRDLADKRIFPAIDLVASSTRREELLMPKAELDVIWKLRRSLAEQDSQQGLELVLDQLKKSPGNAEFLMQVNTTLKDGAARKS
ncbi:transcription termination factor Rho [Aeromicrobium wangtongii]|uniref:Transcription termination factor Rho n=1 Tax=Aeromicrobium wangtongii TaxID=2969247 RepID=A0ABY5MAJ0_9ACTN|nr:transcription termination factor Rho [Aeromicrobium wangtongii]MCD9199164.1 transcription termination factor Rho [Aeromicrobium wangtongii]UUP12806.1 transcription termination factor Rho [Aeromicrobium wangtongii]